MCDYLSLAELIYNQWEVNVNYSYQSYLYSLQF